MKISKTLVTFHNVRAYWTSIAGVTVSRSCYYSFALNNVYIYIYCLPVTRRGPCAKIKRGPPRVSKTFPHRTAPMSFRRDSRRRENVKTNRTNRRFSALSRYWNVSVAVFFSLARSRSSAVLVLSVGTPLISSTRTQANPNGRRTAVFTDVHIPNVFSPSTRNEITECFK